MRAEGDAWERRCEVGDDAVLQEVVRDDDAAGHVMVGGAEKL